MACTLQRNDRSETQPLSLVRAVLTRTLLAFAVLAVEGAGAATPWPATAEKWEGFWATSRKDCLNKEGFDSKTMIDLKNSENGRPAPLFDQYENHCRIDSHATKGNVTTLKLTCFEFWDDYKGKKSPRRDTVTVTPVDPQKILMNGKSYLRCKK
jgi:hypothetical protein